MGIGVKYFMWKWQHTFASAVKVAADGLFGALDPRLAPQVFLVGIRVDSTKGRYPVCLEPDYCPYDPAVLEGVIELAVRLAGEDPAKNALFGDEGAKEKNDRAIDDNSLRKAIEELLNRTSLPDGFKSYCSLPFTVEGYRVCTVLQLAESALGQHYALTKTTAMDRQWVAPSLVNAAIHHFLLLSRQALDVSEPGYGGDVLGRDAQDILRLAGRTLMYTPSLAAEDILSGHKLFRACNEISASRYEGGEASGSMIISRSVHPSVQVELELSSRVSLARARAVRKLLETASRDAYLLSDSEKVYGIGSLAADYNSAEETLFVVRFDGRFGWILEHDGNGLMRVRNGIPELPKPPLDKTQFTDLVSMNLPDADADVDVIWGIANEAARQRHGAMIVVSAIAAQEAARLAGESTCVTPTLLTQRLLEIGTSIDGSVLVDPQGRCHAIGVIIDGLATDLGSPGRGSRFNSAVRYAEGIGKCLIVVVSEDGSVDLIPNQPPPISRQAIPVKIEEFRAIRNNTEMPVREFNLLMNWFNGHEFYMTADQCATVNQLRRDIEASYEGKRGVAIVYQDLNPHERMHDGYYVD